MEKMEIKGILFKDVDADGEEILVKASWVVGNKATVNYHWLNYGDGTVDKQLLSATRKDGKPHATKDIEEQAAELIKAIKLDCLDEYVDEMIAEKKFKKLK